MSLEYYVNKDNWPTDLEEAREFARQAISEWKFKDKVEKHLRNVERATSVERLQQLIVQTMLSGEGLGTIKY